ncbi:MAG TPA: S16 family serine protease [Tepidisphaeraceae bacterium]|nr:S16 family serine protease [Tepidisphaeraceae bacterium]
MRAIPGSVAAACTVLWALLMTAAPTARAEAATDPSTAATSAATAPSTAPAPAAGADGWAPIFRGDDSKIWDSDTGDPSLASGYAIHLDRAPPDMKYLRLKRMDTSEAVIIPLPKEHLRRSLGVGDHVWSGQNEIYRVGADSNRLLGIARRAWRTRRTGDQLIRGLAHRRDAGWRGWGFSKPAGSSEAQGYSWNGEPIDKVVFEIAVKSTDLTEAERAALLTDGTQVAGNDGAAAAAAAPNAARIARRQSSIRCLVVRTDEDGMMLGSTVDLILTGTPGPAREDTPVTYVTAVGDQMKLVLDDVLRNVRIKYGKWEAAKVELSFDDRTSSKDGSSIGAAVGTLILSMLEGYEVDPKLAMTGDVTADGKVRPIGGVAAKVRGAIGSECAIIAVPAGNYDQLADAMVYEGTALLTRIQVLGMGTLDEAQAVARTDRADKLRRAIELFAEVQQAARTPEMLKSKAVREKLGLVSDLAPNHYSAKLLLLYAQDKAPRRLSATASLYYTAVAVNRMLPVLSELDKAANRQQVTPAVLSEGMKSLDKVRRIAHPSVVPLIDAWRDFFRSVGEVQAGRLPVQQLGPKVKALENAAAKINANRDVMEKMVREGV